MSNLLSLQVGGHRRLPPVDLRGGTLLPNQCPGNTYPLERKASERRMCTLPANSPARKKPSGGVFFSRKAFEKMALQLCTPPIPPLRGGQGTRRSTRRPSRVGIRSDHTAL